MSARKKIRVGVVGFGWMGQAHTRSILRIPTLFPEREFDAELVMISDNMASRVDQAVADFGFGHGSVDWNDLIANDDIDVVVICAPNMLHEPIAIAAAEAGKHVFCEKPVGGTPEQTVRIEAATRAAGVITGVGYNYRWAPLVQYAKQLIDAGELGEITNYRGRFFSMYGADPMGLLSWRFMLDEAGHGVSSDILSHSVDLAHMLIGGIEKVVGWATSRFLSAHCPNRAAPTTTSASPATRPAQSRTRTTSARCACSRTVPVASSSRAARSWVRRASARSRCTARRDR